MWESIYDAGPWLWCDCRSRLGRSRWGPARSSPVTGQLRAKCMRSLKNDWHAHFFRTLLLGVRKKFACHSFLSKNIGLSVKRVKQFTDTISSAYTILWHPCSVLVTSAPLISFDFFLPYVLSICQWQVLDFRLEMGVSNKEGLCYVYFYCVYTPHLNSLNFVERFCLVYCLDSLGEYAITYYDSMHFSARKGNAPFGTW